MESASISVMIEVNLRLRGGHRWPVRNSCSGRRIAVDGRE